VNRTRRIRASRRLAAPVLLALCLGLLAAGLLPGEAAACPVCYGNAEGDVIDGAKLSVFFMGGLVYTVMIAGVVMVVAARRRGTRGGDGAHPRPVHDPDSSDRPGGKD
jgi:hypothetical protein